MKIERVEVDHKNPQTENAKKMAELFPDFTIYYEGGVSEQFFNGTLTTINIYSAANLPIPDDLIERLRAGFDILQRNHPDQLVYAIHCWTAQKSQKSIDPLRKVGIPFE